MSDEPPIDHLRSVVNHLRSVVEKLSPQFVETTFGLGICGGGRVSVWYQASVAFVLIRRYSIGLRHCLLGPSALLGASTGEGSLCLRGEKIHCRYEMHK